MNIKFEVEVDDASEYINDYDVVVASDGLNSKTRLKFRDIFKS